MGDAFVDRDAHLLVGHVRFFVAGHCETPRRGFRGADEHFERFEVHAEAAAHFRRAVFARVRVFKQVDFVFEMVEHHHEPVHEVHHRRNAGVVVFGLDFHVLEVLYGVVGQVAEEGVGWEGKRRFRLLKPPGEGPQRGHGVAAFFQPKLLFRPVGEGLRYHLVVEHEAGHRVAGDEAEAVLGGVVVGAFEQYGVGQLVAELEVHANRREQIGQEAAVGGLDGEGHVRMGVVRIRIARIWGYSG